MGEIINLNDKFLPESCFVYKHSTACGISRIASEVVRKSDLPLSLYWINVIEQRSLSRWVANTYRVTHESPQLLYIQEGQVRKVWNHYDIKRENLPTSSADLQNLQVH